MESVFPKVAEENVCVADAIKTPCILSFSWRILFTSTTFQLWLGSFLSFLRNIDEYAICDDGLFSWIFFNVLMISSLSASGLLLFMSVVPALTTIISLSDFPTCCVACPILNLPLAIILTR